MMNHQDHAGEQRPAYRDGGDEAAQAAEHAHEVTKILDYERLDPAGRALAHGMLSLVHAVLAQRGAVSDAAADTADAITDLDATLGILAGAVADAAVADDTSDDRPASRPGVAAARQDTGPGQDYVLCWAPARGPGRWYLLPIDGERPNVPFLEDRNASAGQLAEYAGRLLGYEVTVAPLRPMPAGRLLPPRWRPGPRWSVQAAHGRCDGTTAAVLAVDATGRYLIAPAARPGGLGVLAPPSVHTEGAPWEAAAFAELDFLGVTAADLRPVGSGWRHDRCTRRPAPLGAGHMWRLYRAGVAWGEPRDGARWVTVAELQALADRTTAYAAGQAPAACGEPGLLDLAWLGWLADEGVITVGHDGRVLADALAAGAGVAW